MRRVTGIGGVFFRAQDPAALRAWYQTHLGIDVQDWGGAIFPWTDSRGQPTGGQTVWTISSADEMAGAFVVNYRVENLSELLTLLRAEGCQVLDTVDESEFGKFGWVTDPEGNRVELWEPPAGQ